MEARYPLTRSSIEVDGGEPTANDGRAQPVANFEGLEEVRQAYSVRDFGERRDWRSCRACGAPHKSSRVSASSCGAPGLESSSAAVSNLRPLPCQAPMGRDWPCRLVARHC